MAAETELIGRWEFVILVCFCDNMGSFIVKCFKKKTHQDLQENQSL